MCGHMTVDLPRVFQWLYVRFEVRAWVNWEGGGVGENIERAIANIAFLVKMILCRMMSSLSFSNTKQVSEFGSTEMAGQTARAGQ